MVNDHIAFVYDLTGLQLYIDGKLAGETGAATVLHRVQSAPWFGAHSPEAVYTQRRQVLILDKNSIVAD